jgi:alpha-acetolactate decarboxylase
MAFSKFVIWFATLFEIFMKRYQIKMSGDYQASTTVICYTANDNAEAQNFMTPDNNIPVFNKSNMTGFTVSEGVWSVNTKLFHSGVILHSINEKGLFFIDVDNNLLNINYV